MKTTPDYCRARARSLEADAAMHKMLASECFGLAQAQHHRRLAADYTAHAAKWRARAHTCDIDSPDIAPRIVAAVVAIAAVVAVIAGQVN